MRAIVIGLCCLCGCGRIAFDPLASSDGGIADGDVAMISGRHWVNRNDGAPGALWGPRLAYHAARGTVILYGGSLPGGTISDAMWELTDAGWVQLCGSCAPAGRAAPQLAYDRARDRIVLYGGFDSGSFDDHWEWDQTTWTRVFANAPPGPRDGGQLIYDAPRSSLVLIGGGSTPADLFEYDGTWGATGTMPVELSGGGTQATFDPVGHRTFVLNQGGGLTFDDVWTRSSGSATWTQACASCIGRARADGSIVYDPSTASLYLINGYDENLSEGIAGTWQWREGSVANVSSLPPERDSSGVAYDERRNVIVLYGGNGFSCNGGAGGNCAETWEMVPD